MQGIHVSIRDARAAGSVHALAQARDRRPALFLDRDGVIVEETNYLHRVEDIRYLPGALEAIARVNRAGIPVVVVTNQAGVGRGYYGWEEYEAVERRIEQDLAAAGGRLDGVWACAFHPEGEGELRADHRCRKPEPGMLEEAAQELSLALGESWLVGDKLIDLEAAIRGGLAGATLVLTGYGERMRQELARLERGGTEICVAVDLAAAVEEVLGRLRP